MLNMWIDPKPTNMYWSGNGVFHMLDCLKSRDPLLLVFSHLIFEQRSFQFQASDFPFHTYNFLLKIKTVNTAIYGGVALIILRERNKSTEISTYLNLSEKDSPHS